MTAAGRPHLVFKILASNAWQETVANGTFTGSPDDGRDGFIHLSAAHQIVGTLAKHYAGQAGLILVAYEAEQLGGALRWEASRGGEMFPHLYGPLPASLALWAEPIHMGLDGEHRLPSKVTAC